MTLADDFIDYISSVKRYSERTRDIYRDVLDDFVGYAFEGVIPSDEELKEALTTQIIRGYEVYLMDERKMKAKTVCQHLSALSSFSRYLILRGEISSNPVSAVKRPKVPKRLPEFFRKDAMDKYFEQSERYASEEYLYEMASDAFPGCLEKNKGLKDLYEKRLARAIISTLYSTGMRRSELIGLDIKSFDESRKIISVRGKGDKMREIPVIDALCKELLLYLESVRRMVQAERGGGDAFFVTAKGARLYPEYVERVVKSELSAFKDIKGRKSPHVLRHSLATELLDEGTDMYSIKELLGHSSLAATQVYTHASVEQLKKIYQTAHPRAQKGGKYGD